MQDEADFEFLANLGTSLIKLKIDLKEFVVIVDNPCYTAVTDHIVGSYNLDYIHRCTAIVENRQG